MTRWPILARAAGLTAVPTAATMPHGSWPAIVGSLGAARPPVSPPAFGPAVLVQIAAAHARGLHLDDDLALARCRIGKLHQLELAIAGKDDPAHRILLACPQPIRLAGSLTGC